MEPAIDVHYTGGAAGLAHVVQVGESFIQGEPFVFYLGDNVVVGGIRRFIDTFWAAGDQCHLVLARVKDPGRFGVPEIKEGRIIAIEEKPPRPKSDFAVTGIYLYDAAIFEAVRNLRPSGRGELEISEAHQYLIDHGLRVSFSEITGWWKDTGKPEDLLEANRLVLDQILPANNPRIEGKVDDLSDIAGKVVIGPGAEIVNSQIRGPAVVGERARITESYVGPFTSIGAGCEVCDSEIEYSILMDEARILSAAVRIERSILGCGAMVFRTTARPRTQRFVVGDHSSIELP